MKVTKEITFDSAHMLSNYEGKCSNLHGHTYKLQVTLESNVLKNHMVLDFNVLKEILNEAVMDNFDHAVIFSQEEIRGEAENDLLVWCKKWGKKFTTIPGKTTCEDMAPYIKRLVEENLYEKNIDALVWVRLWETPTSFAEC